MAYPPLSPQGSHLSRTELIAIALKANFATLDNFADTFTLKELLAPLHPGFTQSTTTIEADSLATARLVALAHLNPDLATMTALSFYKLLALGHDDC
jgi:hypothetical protein